MNKAQAKTRWYWVAGSTLRRSRGGWVHAGACRLVGEFEGWKMYPCGTTEKLWEPGYGGHAHQDQASGEVCLVCKRWEPPDEPV